MKLLQKQEMDYKWVIIASCFLMIFTGLGFCNSPKSMFISAITDALEMKRSLFSINDSCRYIATAVTNMFFGTLVSRFGTKKLIGVGFISLILSCMIYSFSDSVLMFCVGGSLLGIGIAFTTTAMVGCIINKWCRSHKGTIMGLVLAANGLGGALAIRILSPIIYQKDTLFGYKDAYRLTAAILFAVGGVILICFREKPENNIVESTEKLDEEDRTGQKQNWSGIDYSEAIKKSYFYGVIACVFVSGMCLEGVYGIAAAHMTDIGLGAVFVVRVLSLNALTMALFKFLTGFIYDKLGLRITMSMCCVAGVTVMFALAAVNDSKAGMAYALIYGIFSSLAFPLETVLLPICTGELFGLKSFDKILGILAAVNVAGYAIGAPAVNICYDIWGSYKPALLASGMLMLMITVILQFVLRKAQKEKSIE